MAHLASGHWEWLNDPEKNKFDWVATRLSRLASKEQCWWSSANNTIESFKGHWSSGPSEVYVCDNANGKNSYYGSVVSDDGTLTYMEGKTNTGVYRGEYFRDVVSGVVLMATYGEDQAAVLAWTQAGFNALAGYGGVNLVESSYHVITLEQRKIKEDNCLVGLTGGSGVMIVSLIGMFVSAALVAIF